MHVRRWLAKQQHDPLRWSVEDALASGRPYRYAAYRLRFFALAQLLAIAIHVVELVFLRRLFVLPSLVPVFIAQSLAQIGIAVWWGLLESMRERIRAAMRVSDRDTASRIASRFLSTAAIVATLVMLAALLSVEPRLLFSGESVAAVEVFKVLAGTRVAIYIVARTYHSAASALRRIYRPFWALLLTDALGLVLVPVLYPAIGAWALPIRFVALSALSVGLTILFVRRTLKSLKFYPLRLSLSEALDDPFYGTRGRVLAGAALAWGATQAGSALTLVAAGVHGGAHDQGRTVIFYLLSPVLTASAMWGNVFYFDLVRYRARTFDVVREAMLRSLRVVALGWGVGLGTLGIAVAHTLRRKEDIATPWFLPVLAALLAGSSLEQTRLFVASRYRAVLVGIGVIAFGVALMHPARQLTASLGDVAQTVSEMVVLSTAVLAATEYLRSRKVVGELLGLSPAAEWAKALRGESSPASVGYARLRSSGAAPTALLGKLLLQRFPDLAWTYADRRTVMWFAPAAQAPLQFARASVLLSAGLVREAGVLVEGETGVAAAARVVSWQQDTDFVATTPSEPTESFPELVERFQTEVPGGRVVSFVTGAPSMADLGARSRVRLLRAGVSDSRPHTVTPKWQRDVIAYAPSLVLSALFVLPATMSADDRKAWRHRVQTSAARVPSP